MVGLLVDTLGVTSRCKFCSVLDLVGDLGLNIMGGEAAGPLGQVGLDSW